MQISNRARTFAVNAFVALRDLHVPQGGLGQPVYCSGDAEGIRRGLEHARQQIQQALDAMNAD